MAHTLGIVSLNLSLCLYLILFIPQIITNHKRQGVGISYGMHLILCLGYLADCLYGYGLHLNWQYRLVTVIGLLSLGYQHYQIYRYNGQDHPCFSLTTACLGAALITAIAFIHWPLSHTQYDAVGMLSNAAWLLYALPQIYKQAQQHSTAGLSCSFLYLTLTLSVLDGMTYWLLNWDYPSKIGHAIRVCEHLFLLYQVYRYRGNLCQQLGASSPMVNH